MVCESLPEKNQSKIEPEAKEENENQREASVFGEEEYLQKTSVELEEVSKGDCGQYIS